MLIEPTKAVKIFFSYAHEDKKLREELDKHLGALKRSGLIITWYDRDIQAGMQWEDEIETRLNTADLILLLISHHFINSDYCYGREMLRALERHEKGEARVIPIILSPVSWEDTPISKLNALPHEGKSITESRNRNTAFMQVVQDIRKVVKTFINQQEIKYQTIQKQHQKMIDTHEAVRLFHLLMKTDSENSLRVMYLIGDASMGKSHLLKNVFPVLAQHEYQANCIQFDLRNPIYAISDILHMAFEQLGPTLCHNYAKSVQEMSNLASLEGGNISHILTNFASLNISKPSYLINNVLTRDERLTTQMVLDLSKLDSKPLVLFFDSVNDAAQPVQSWLIKILLTKLSLLSHVRIVVAGRSIIEPPIDYIDLLYMYQLSAVKDEDEYITFCRGLNTPLSEEIIRSLARDCDYIPGLFASTLFTAIGPRGV